MFLCNLEDHGIPTIGNKKLKQYLPVLVEDTLRIMDTIEIAATRPKQGCKRIFKSFGHSAGAGEDQVALFGIIERVLVDPPSEAISDACVMFAPMQKLASGQPDV
jgi:hypothetical protein